MMIPQHFYQTLYFGFAPHRLRVAAVALMLAGGCGDSETGIPTVPVSGKVTLAGEPLSGAQITFMNEEFAAYAETDETGHFALTPGAPVGENKVVISKWEGGVAMNEEDGVDAEQMAAMAGMGGGADAPKQLVPTEYTSAETTSLRSSVPEEGTDSANFDL